ncbi:MAG: bifunctional diguanylate cyclase/phosphodiesterase [Campylobacterota bacterium]
MIKFLYKPLFLFVVAVAFIHVALYFEYALLEQKYKDEKIKSVRLSYQDAMSSQQKLMQMVAQQITKNYEIAALMQQATTNPQDADKIRTTIAKRLGPLYKDIQAFGVEQFGFHLRDATSFYRFHQPQTHGDNLLDRSLVSRMIYQKSPLYGYEIGKFSDGFAYLYPLFYLDRYVGSFEISISPIEFLSSINQNANSVFKLILKKQNLQSMLPKDRLQQIYTPSCFSNEYYMNENIYCKSKLLKSAVQNIDKPLQKKLKTQRAFVLNTKDAKAQQKVFTFLPLFNYDKEFVGYIVSIAADDYLYTLKQQAGIKYAFALFALFIVYLVYKRQQNTNNLLEQLREVIENSTLVSKTDPKGKISYVNEEFVKLSGYSKEELLGKPHSIIRHPDMPKQVFADMWEKLRSGKIWRGRVKNRKKDGSFYVVDARIFPIFDQRGKIKEYIAIRNDITEIMDPKRQLLQDIERIQDPFLVMLKVSQYESLKEFYGVNFVQDLDEMIEQRAIGEFRSRELFEKVYGLKEGYIALLGSRVIKHEHLQKMIKTFQSQNFTIHSTKLELEFYASYSSAKEFLYEDVSFGVDKAGGEKEGLFKSDGLARLIKDKTEQNMQMIAKIKRAIADKKIISHYQPIVDAKTLEPIKYESLVRLIDEKDTMIAPFFFLETAKKAAYYKDITKIVIENSFGALQKLPCVTINLSSKDLEDDEIRGILLSLVQKDIYHNKITFELLEDEEVNDFTVIQSFIAQVKQYGVQIAIDDFGSGYSNYERLSDFAPDILKIDAGLIKNIDKDSYTRSIVESIVLFAKEQKIKTVAEFVSSQEIAAVVIELGVDYLQGFHVGKPKDIDDIPATPHTR